MTSKFEILEILFIGSTCYEEKVLFECCVWFSLRFATLVHKGVKKFDMKDVGPTFKFF